MDNEFYCGDHTGLSRVIDAIFLGEKNSSKDLRFVRKYNITHIVNCAGNEIQNLFSNYGVRYMTLFWLDDDRQ